MAKTRDHKFEYWKEAVETSLDDMGIPHALTAEQIEHLAGDMEGNADNQGMAFGHDAIPNPLQAEVRAADNRTNALRKDAEKREAELKQTITDLRYRIRDLEYRLSEAREASRR